MRLDARQLNRATLARQDLLARSTVGAAEAVRRVVALQAQEPAAPYVALWNRIEGFDAADLDAAFAGMSVLKSSSLRLTLHAVHADDHPAVHAAMVPSRRASRLGDRRFTATGVPVAEVDRLLPEVIEFLAQPRRGREVEAFLAERLGAGTERVWWAMKMFAPVVHAPTGGPWSFGASASFVAAPSVASGRLARIDHGEAVAALVRRALEGFGPMTAQDLAQFTILRAPVVQAALAALGDRIEVHEGPDGRRLYDLVGTPGPDGDVDAPPRLLGMWDGVLLAYADRSRIVPEEARAHVIRRNGDVLPSVLVDGRVVGVWRPTPDGIEATLFERCSRSNSTALAVEAARLAEFLRGRDPAAFGRYGHWWHKGIPGEVTMLSGPLV